MDQPVEPRRRPPRSRRAGRRGRWRRRRRGPRGMRPSMARRSIGPWSATDRERRPTRDSPTTSSSRPSTTSATRTGGNANSTTTVQPSRAWERRRPLFEHLAATGDRWWFAEDEATGEALGYARSILRDGVRELTEFFVLPEAQGGGVGRESAGTRPSRRTARRHRAIIATIDPQAITPLPPDRARRPGPDGLRRGRPTADRPRRPTSCASRIDPDAPPLEDLAAIDRVVLGFRRDVDHAWLASSGRAGCTSDGRSWRMRTTIEPSWGGRSALDRRLPVLLADAETRRRRPAGDIAFDWR